MTREYHPLTPEEVAETTDGFTDRQCREMAARGLKYWATHDQEHGAAHRKVLLDACHHFICLRIAASREARQEAARGRERRVA